MLYIRIIIQINWPYSLGADIFCAI